MDVNTSEVKTFSNYNEDETISVYVNVGNNSFKLIRETMYNSINKKRDINLKLQDPENCEIVQFSLDTLKDLNILIGQIDKLRDETCLKMASTTFIDINEYIKIGHGKYPELVSFTIPNKEIFMDILRFVNKKMLPIEIID